MTTTPSFFLGIGDDWPLPITYSDAQGNPINLTGATVGGELYFAYQSQPVLEMTVANGGITAMDPTNGHFTFFVPKTLTTLATADKANAKITPNRLQVWIVDSLGRRETIAIFAITVFDPRFVDPGAFAQHQAGMITAPGVQGPAGASGLPGQQGIQGPQGVQGPPGSGVASVNGKTTQSIVLTAHDVGAPTISEAAAQAAALALIIG